MNNLVKIIIVVISLILTFLMLRTPVSYEHKTVKILNINKKYLQILVALANPKTSQDIIAKNEGKLIEKHWNSNNVQLHQFIMPIWDAEAEGGFSVLNDGKTLNFTQEIVSNENYTFVNTYLKKPCDHIIQHQTIIQIYKKNDKTTVKLTSYIRIYRNTFFLFHDYVKSEVRRITKEEVYNIESSLHEQTNKPSFINNILNSANKKNKGIIQQFLKKIQE